MKRQDNDPEFHLHSRHGQKYLCQCIRCQKVGYRLEVVQRHASRQYIKKRFSPLVLNSAGLCEICQEIAISSIASREVSDA